ncbi:MAG TPA: MCE family protein, partial [Candidatus Gracilibacteria bacterium]|nr:MCE family protein [Candidatus Gracilibacteria bacterium]
FVNNLNRAITTSNSPAGVLLSDKEAAAHLQETMKNLESGSKKLDEDLEALQHNFLFRGYFKNKK